MRGLLSYIVVAVAFGEVAEWFPEGTPSEEGASLKNTQMFVAYMLRSLKDGSHYYGATSSLLKRIREHNGGKVRYTRGHRPYELLYSETFASKTEALKRERFFKSIEVYRWLRANGIIAISRRGGRVVEGASLEN